MKLDFTQIKDSFLNFIVPIIALGLTMVMFFVVIYPSFGKIPELQDTLSAKSELENSLKSKLTTLNKLVDFTPVVDENAGVLERVLVADPNVPILLTQVDTIARESGLEVTKLSYSFGELAEEDAQLSYSVVNIGLGTTGNYDQIKTFLRNLEGSARLVDVTTFRFSAHKDEENSELFGITFILRSPYLFVESQAITDEPINLDISDPEFVAVLEIIKDLKFYDISIDTKYVDVEEVSEEELEEELEAEEEEVPEGTVSEEELEELIEEEIVVEEESPTF